MLSYVLHFYGIDLWARVEVKNNVQELILSFQCVDPGNKIQVIGLAASTLTH